MAEMPTYEQLEQQVSALENERLERKWVEEALRESEERLRIAGKAAYDLIYEWNVPNDVLEWFGDIDGLLGYEPGAISRDIGAWLDLIHPEDRGQLEDAVELHRTATAPIRYEYRIKHRDGTYRRLLDHALPMFDKQDRPHKWIGVCTDITERKRAQEALQKAHEELEIRVEERTVALSKANEVLSVEIAERKQAEEALRESEEKYRSILENIEEAYYEVDIAGRFTFFNDSLSKITGYSADEIMGTNIRSYTDQNCAMEGAKAFRDVYTTGKSVKGFAWEITRKNGGKKHAEVSASLIRDGEGKGIGFLGIIRDVSERKRTQQQLKSSLKEKETLLREIHHRVKNNMQIVISLLRLQSTNIKDKKYAGLFKDSANRMKSMALIHEALYLSKDLASIDFNGYVKSIANPLIKACMVNADRIKLNITSEDISLGVDHAIPCGLIINELVSNSLKYAFPEDGEGEIKIVIRPTKNHEIELTVSDDGIGIPAEMDMEKTESLGLQIVSILAEDQLDGTLALLRDGGTSFRIRFRD